MDGRRWEGVLEHLEGELRCAVCKRGYPRSAMTLAGVRDGYYFVSCACGSCASKAIAVIIVRELVAAVAGPRDERPPLTEDDVLDAASLLRPMRVTLHDLGISS